MPAPAFGSSPSPSVPWANPGERNVLYCDGTASAPFNASVPFSGSAGTSVLLASGEWIRSVILNVERWRKLWLEVAYDANAASALGFAQILPLVSSAVVLTSDGTAGPPLAGDDVWFAPAVSDQSVTPGALAAGTMPTGSDFNKDISWNRQRYRGLVLDMMESTANSSKGRTVVAINVEGSKWFQLAAREIGDTTNRGILNLAYVGTT